jgi:carbamoyl-phosphate synthase large subunit
VCDGSIERRAAIFPRAISLSRMPALGPHVVILAPGSKVGLVRALAEAVAVRGGTLTGFDGDPHAPAAAFCARRVNGGPLEDEASVEEFLAWCVRENVKLVVPARHNDLPALAAARERFAAAGIALIVSSRECVELCLDKTAVHAWLARGGFPLPEQTSVAELERSSLRDAFPLIAKDPAGSGSKGVRLCGSAADLAGVPPHWLVQRIALGSEFTINVYVDRAGRSACEIPHERLLVGEGEVVRGRTARVPELMTLARRIAESLPGARGPLNIQIFWEAQAKLATVIEINPRFGGGYPLAHRAGGRFTDWLLAEYLDGVTPRLDAWEDGLLMVRYREALFFPAKKSRGV